MTYIKNCLRCGEALPEDAHGNLKRCEATCAKQHKRDINRNRQKIIRELGKHGLKNYKVLEYLYAKYAQNGILEISQEKLVHIGFRFNIGVTQIELKDSESEYPNILHVINYELRYHAIQKDKPVLIIKFKLI